MLEPPDLQDGAIHACLREAYGIAAARVVFLPLGADAFTAVYRVVGQVGTPYFLKLRWGAFDETSVELPRFLCDQGVRQVIAPLPARSGRLWADLNDCKAILYPFVEGQDGYAVRLPERQWSELGAALRQIHSLELPVALAGRIRQEAYSPRWREAVRAAMGRLAEAVDEPVAVRMAAFLEGKRDEVLRLVDRAEALAHCLRSHPPQPVLCHSDLHAGNLLIDAKGAFYIVDWDEPILAPRERDLMFIGGAQGFAGYRAEEEVALFYRGYGRVEIHPEALAYYRYERIVADLAAFCDQLLWTTEGGANREQALRWAMSNFAPGHALEAAYAADAAWRTQQ